MTLVFVLLSFLSVHVVCLCSDATNSSICLAMGSGMCGNGVCRQTRLLLLRNSFTPLALLGGTCAWYQNVCKCQVCIYDRFLARLNIGRSFYVWVFQLL